MAAGRFGLVDLDLPLSVSACDCRSRENSPSQSRSSPNWVFKASGLAYSIYIHVPFALLLVHFYM